VISDDSSPQPNQDGSTTTESSTPGSSLTYWQKRYQKPGEKERRAAYSRNYYLEHKDEYRVRERQPNAQARRKAYSRTRQGMEYLSQTDWEALFEQQGQACALCGNSRGPWVTDHDHTTGKIRGILCRRCNMALSMFHDCLPLLEVVVIYLG
jgi:hypothetical protein